MPLVKRKVVLHLEVQMPQEYYEGMQFRRSFEAMLLDESSSFYGIKCESVEFVDASEGS